jgi:hypothetical protein
MRSLCLVAFTLPLALFGACTDTKDETKGVVDESEPPSIPVAGPKGDEASSRVAVNVQSPHPYGNNLDRAYPVSLASLPACTQEARIHFKVLRTEARYDFVVVEPTGSAAQSFDGTRDDTWTEWFPATNAQSVNVRLDTDSSITRHGFEIDAVEWQGQPAGCPQVRPMPCGDGFVDIQKRPGTCECPVLPICVALDTVEVRYSVSRGFNVDVKIANGTQATHGRPGPADGIEYKNVGTLDAAKLTSFLRRAGETGALRLASYDTFMQVDRGSRRDELTITAGETAVSFVANEGEHPADVQALMNEFAGLFTCDSGELTCGDGFTCQEGACVVEESCVCTAQYDPVCGADGQTYSNGCAAGCANAEVIHDGECGITGDFCGGFGGIQCAEDFRCRYEGGFTAPYPDAGGHCVARNYCDVPADCAELPHPAVPGSWKCETNTCGWQAGAQWRPVTNGRFESAHPYANSASVWKEIYLPAEAQAIRLNTASFKLERNYDFLEVWTWTNGAWVRAKRFTGTTGPALTEEFAGRYFYLRFVSDSSVNDQGFRLDAEWR